MKIHLIGGSGSGKTTIAARLSARFELPVLDLDILFWNQKAPIPYATKATPEERDLALDTFITQPNWIVEGVYYSWLLTSFRQADHILVLTTPLWLRQIRIVRRFLRRKLELPARNKESLRSLRLLLAYNHAYDRKHLAQAVALLENEKLSYARCSAYEDVLAAISPPHRTASSTDHALRKTS
jgi:adenylate kinase family enzyme